MYKVVIFGHLSILGTAQWGAKADPPKVSCGNHYVPGSEFDHQKTGVEAKGEEKNELILA